MILRFIKTLFFVILFSFVANSQNLKRTTIPLSSNSLINYNLVNKSNFSQIATQTILDSTKFLSQALTKSLLNFGCTDTLACNYDSNSI